MLEEFETEEIEIIRPGIPAKNELGELISSFTRIKAEAVVTKGDFKTVESTGEIVYLTGYKLHFETGHNATKRDMYKVRGKEFKAITSPFDYKTHTQVKVISND